MIKGFYVTVSIATVVSGLLTASPQAEATPWTKSFLETRVAASVERYAIRARADRWRHTPKNQIDGTLFATSAPLQDWEFDLGVQGKSLPTRKLFCRAERQIFSDLQRDPLAVTLVADVSSSGHQRSRRPVFFEMAKNVAECGIGVGRHLVIRRDAYTQLFAYLLAGIGSSKARFVSGELGVQQMFFQHHFLRLSYIHMKTFGHNHGRFRGIGTIKTDVNTITASYAYRWYNGIEARVSYIHRILTSGSLRRSSTCQVGVSIPISL